MRSSSKLFPVSLMAAETIGPFNEDVYELRPGKSSDPSVSLALTRVTDPRTSRQGPSVVFLHGEFGNRRVWFSPTGQGLAADLAEQGMDVWLAEMRGHGLSPRNRHWQDNCLSDYGSFDWPAVNAFVLEQAGTAPLWVGAGIGALSLAFGLIYDPKFQRQVSGVALLNLPVNNTLGRHWGPFRQFLARRQGVIEGLRRGLGPEDEPVRVYDEMRFWAALGRKNEHPIYDRLRRIDIPTLVVNEADLDPEGDHARRLTGLLGASDKHFVIVPPQHEPKGRAAQMPGGTPIAPGAEAAVLEWVERLVKGGGIKSDSRRVSA